MNQASKLLLAVFGIVLIVGVGDPVSGQTPATPALKPWIEEFALPWPKHDNPKLDAPGGSTHEITYNHHGGDVFWVTGQKHDALARITLDGKPTFFKLRDGCGPHGIVFDTAGRLWVTLEFNSTVAEIDPANGHILREIDVSLHVHATGAGDKSELSFSTHPHGLGLGPDGQTLWFTGKSTGTVGRINKDGSVDHFQLSTVGSVPIYIVAGPDGAMWCTELVGNAIARITADGKVTEYPIPTVNSRPIAITPGPDGKSMWFSEEAGNKIGRIDMQGHLTEFPVPKLHGNTILAGLTFDREGHLWTQAYIDPNNELPEGTDALVKIDKAITSAGEGDITSVPVTYYQVPTLGTIMHRITEGPDGNLWFTELAADKVGRLEFLTPAEAAKRPPPPKSLHLPIPSMRGRGLNCCE